jgi:hypothetical protein
VIRKLVMIPLKILEIILIIIAVLCFLCIGILDYFQKDRSPIRYSKDGKVVDLDDFRTNPSGREL